METETSLRENGQELVLREDSWRVNKTRRWTGSKLWCLIVTSTGVDVWKKELKMIDHNRPQALALSPALSVSWRAVDGLQREEKG